MITIDGAIFSERRSEEVISFFWRSVYIMLVSSKLAHLGLKPFQPTQNVNYVMLDLF